MPRAKAARPFARPRTQPPPSRLTPLTGFAPNPGALRGWQYVPALLPRRAPLVVVLHGCTQTAAGYDHAAGWSRLADERGFALLFPEQVRANNANGCFNWFVPGDIARGSGEVASIAAMVAAMLATHGLDPARVFVTGLSAGGAMTAALCAAYPDLFAGGAVIAGLPYGAAHDIGSAFAAMAQPARITAAALGDRVRAASRHTGAWPRLSIWHGDADATVAPANAGALAAQWTDVHRLPTAPSSDRTDGAARHRIWANAAGVAQVELWTIPGMGHGTPVDARGGTEAAAPFMLDVQLSSTRRIAAFWGLADAAAATRAADPPRAAPPVAPGLDLSWQKHLPAGVKTVINDALRAAGLLGR